ncbi:MAG: hypothetical protein QXK70_06720 [Archaeoglobaceae archaeon]
MRLEGLSLLFLFIIATAHGFEITVYLKNYDGKAMLNVFNDSKRILEKEISSGEVISLPEGNYTFTIFALNKSFVKKVAVTKNQDLDFNLGFTDDSSILSFSFHTIVKNDMSVDEIIIVNNTANLNFEGDVAIQISNFSDLQLLSSNLDFLDLIIQKDSILFKSLLVAEKSSDSIRISYKLTLDSINRDFNGIKVERAIIITNAEVLDYNGLSYKETIYGDEKIRILEGNGSYYVKFKFYNIPNISFAIIAIGIICGSIFFLFFANRGRWEE